MRQLKCGCIHQAIEEKGRDGMCWKEIRTHWIAVHDDTSTISDCLTDTTHCYRNAIKPCLVADKERDVGESEEGKNREEEGVEGEIWFVAIDCVFD